MWNMHLQIWQWSDALIISLASHTFRPRFPTDFFGVSACILQWKTSCLAHKTMGAQMQLQIWGMMGWMHFQEKRWQSLSFLFSLPHSPCGRLPCSLQSHIRSCISLTPVSQFLKEKDCVQSIYKCDRKPYYISSVLRSITIEGLRASRPYMTIS